MKITLENLTPEAVLTLATYFLAESGHAELSIDQSWHPEDHLTPGQLTKHRISNELFHLHHILTQEMETEAKQNILKLVS